VLRRFTYGAVFAAVTVLACVLSERRIQAMRLSEAGTAAAMEAAATKDPGSFRVQMRAADLFVSRNECTKARPHALAARGLFPYSPGPRRVLSRCRS
jgi:hypothetical protein